MMDYPRRLLPFFCLGICFSSKVGLLFLLELRAVYQGRVVVAPNPP
jgi:hypothetical protein